MARFPDWYARLDEILAALDHSGLRGARPSLHRIALPAWPARQPPAPPSLRRPARGRDPHRRPQRTPPATGSGPLHSQLLGVPRSARGRQPDRTSGNRGPGDRSSRPGRALPDSGDGGFRAAPVRGTAPERPVRIGTVNGGILKQIQPTRTIDPPLSTRRCLVFARRRGITTSGLDHRNTKRARVGGGMRDRPSYIVQFEGCDGKVV